MEPDNEVAALLNTNVASLTLATNLFRGAEFQLDDSVYPAVFCQVSGGSPPIDHMGSGNGTVWFTRVSVLIVGAMEKTSDTKDLALECRNVLHRATVAGAVRCRVSESWPFYLGKDDEGHPRWMINVEFVYET